MPSSAVSAAPVSTRRASSIRPSLAQGQGVKVAQRLGIKRDGLAEHVADAARSQGGGLGVACLKVEVVAGGGAVEHDQALDLRLELALLPHQPRFARTAPLGRSRRATIRAAARLQHWVCENAKTTRAYLKRVDVVTPLAHPLQQMQLQELPREVHKKGDHLGEFDARGLLAPALDGHDVGLVSEAGMPAIADPGASVVRAAHQLGLEVVPLVGPISLMLVLAASGLNLENAVPLL